jgi:hypothetical protein
MIERVAGLINAAPTPWTMRAPIGIPASGARAQASEEPPKITSPITSMRRRPSRSPSLPPVSRREANVSA